MAAAIKPAHDVAHGGQRPALATRRQNPPGHNDVSGVSRPISSLISNPNVSVNVSLNFRLIVSLVVSPNVRPIISLIVSPIVRPTTSPQDARHAPHCPV